MTRILILGGGGMIGQKLAKQLLADDPDTDITLHDIAFPANGVAATRRIGDVADPQVMTDLANEKFDTIYYLASVVSGEAEQAFVKGWSTNLYPMMALLEGLRIAHQNTDGQYRPRIVFTSSIAVFGGPYPDSIADNYFASPQTSYGAQKLACETLLQDYSRKGFVDGISLRLPTICVRPGAPNKAASSFFSGIIREPLAGQKAVLPVPDDTRHWFASPRAAVNFLIHAATLDTDLLLGRRSLNLPGVSCTVAEQIEALRDIAGQDTVNLIKPQPDAAIAKIVSGWPRNFAPERAWALGFEAEHDFGEIIKTYVAEDMPQT